MNPPPDIVNSAVVPASLTRSYPVYGSAVTGAFLLAAFGLGTVPLTGVSGGLFGAATRPQDTRGLRATAGIVLIALGSSVAFAALALPTGFIDAWCARP